LGRGEGPRACPRSSGDRAVCAGAGPPQAGDPLPGTRLSVDGCEGECGEEAASLGLAPDSEDSIRGYSTVTPRGLQARNVDGFADLRAADPPDGPDRSRTRGDAEHSGRVGVTVQVA